MVAGKAAVTFHMPLNSAYWAKTYRTGLKWRGRSWRVGKDAERIFIKEVMACVGRKTALLDIGCGTGRTVKQLAPRVKEAWGIDRTRILINAAKKGAPSNAHFKVADGRRLPFPDEAFDTLISQRGPATENMRFAKEVRRVLRRGGIFIALSIGEHDKENVKRIFSRGQRYNEMIQGRTERDRQRRLLRGLGFRRINVKDYNVVEYFPTLDDLVSRLERAPIIPHFHKIRDKRLLGAVERQIRDRRGLKTNYHTIIVKAVK